MRKIFSSSPDGHICRGRETALSVRFTQEALIAQVRVEYSSSCADSSLKQFTDIVRNSFLCSYLKLVAFGSQV